MAILLKKCEIKRIGLLYLILMVVFAAGCSPGEGGPALPKNFTKQKVAQSDRDTTAEKTKRQNTALREENARLQQESAQLREQLLQERLAQLAARQDSVKLVLVKLEVALEQAREDSLAAIQTRDSLLRKQLFTTQMDKEIQERLITNSKALDVQLGKQEEQPYSREAEKNRQFYFRFFGLLGLLLFLLMAFYFLRRRIRKRKQ